MTINELITKWEGTAKYHRKCYRETSDHDAEIRHEAKADLADDIVSDLREAKRSRRE